MKNQTFQTSQITKIPKMPKIPKILHYCWFGGKPIPSGLQKCIDSWKILSDYEVVRWDESNCTFDENEFVRYNYEHGNVGFIGDYYRLKCLYEYGGIYLDTDVVVNKSFDDLLGYSCFINFIYDCSVGTAIIGAEKGNSFIKNLIEMYDNCKIREKKGSEEIVAENGCLYVDPKATSNYFFTYHILNKYKEFRLNNKFQNMEDFVIFPKELFEIGKLNNKHYEIHLCAGAWRTNHDEKDKMKRGIKAVLSKSPWLYEKCRIIVRKRRYKNNMKYIPFYSIYLSHKKK